MSKKKTIQKENVKLPVAKIFPAREIIAVDNVQVELRKITQIGELLWLPENLEEKDRNVRIVLALELYESLEPAEGAEGMLAAQMVGTHLAALECLRRAAIVDQTFQSRDMNLKNAQKLMTLYAQQLGALNKHRGKGQQKVTVEHVNVEAGGQAIVGNVEASAARAHKRTGSAGGVHEKRIDLDTEPVKRSAPENEL